MRFLLTPIGSAGDNLPFIGLGARLSQRGHSVTVLTIEPFAPLVRQLGMHCIEIGTTEEYQANTRNPHIFHPTRGFGTVMAMVREYNSRLLPVLEAQTAAGDCMVVAHGLDLASRILQDATDLPVVTAHLAPAMLRSSHKMSVMTAKLDLSPAPRFIKQAFWWLLDKLMLDRELAGFVNRLRADKGLPPVRRIFAHWLHSPLLTLAMFPEWFAPPQPDWPAPLKLTGFPLFEGPHDRPIPENVDRFLDDGPPPVVVTPGSANTRAATFVATTIEACRKLGKRCLVLTSHTQNLPDHLPANTMHAPFAPLTAILPRCAALIHHGGIGTCAAGLAGGVPQFIMPMSHDQPDNLHRLKLLGVAEGLMPRHFTPARLAPRLDAILNNPQVATRCQTFARLCAEEDGLARACNEIEAVIPAPLTSDT